MKKIEKFTRPAEEATRVTARICDICGFESNDEDWKGGYYDFDETEIYIKIKREEGNRYPDGGYSETTEIDLCPECFKNKLVPWLESQGAKINSEDISW